MTGTSVTSLTNMALGGELAQPSRMRGSAMPNRFLRHLSSYPREYVALSIGVAWVGLVSWKKGIFGEQAAAWTQAVGSVAAIVAAIVIDQGAARRLRAERKFDQMSAVVARRSAVLNCSKSVGWMTAHLSDWQPESNTHWTPGRAQLRAMEGARDSVRYFLQQTATEVDAALVVSLTHADRIMSELITDFRSHLPVMGSHRDGWLEKFSAAEDDLAGLVMEYEGISNLPHDLTWSGRRPEDFSTWPSTRVEGE